MPIRDLQALEALVTLYATGTLVETSRRLAVPRTTVKRRLEQLEAELGVALVQPRGTRLVLTPAGLLAARRAHELLASARQLQQAVREEDERAHRLRVALPNGFGWGLISPLLEPHHALVAGLSIEVVNVDRHVHPTHDGFDLVVSFTRPSDESLLCRTFGTLAWRCLATPDYFQRHGCPRRVEALASHRLAALSIPGCPGPRQWPLRSGGALEIEPWFVANSIDAVETMTREGHAIALLPTLVEPPPPFERVLAAGRTEEVGATGRIFLVTQQRLGGSVSGRQLARVAEAVRKTLRERQGGR